ncbi:type IX secretion system membrane protein, PorP/SprF family [Flavobacterium segetis]|uniref:Type IX secretion system membrane protein, PorP/SprF family n=1 Tax=Flavobacterium segetis TaxID=271157 RepID=A0A1M5FFR8_9FLAO|nr:PorP/SprF family type IX secretion system membrane protein [Flavobacterium segetis]SHF90259.1 type IX secretion system membrane protein, PorP/SprF family [Flavobacterium segetis]
MKFKILFTILSCLFIGEVKAQDPIFTQYFLIPETLNPGFSGFLETTYAGIINRSQWPDLDLKIDTDYAFFNTWNEKMNSGIGFSVLNHRENNTKYSFTQFNVNYAYKVALNDEWYFRPAIEIGYGTKSFGFDNLLLADQINIGSGAINPVSGDPLILNDRFKFFDFTAGMVINNENSWFGLSLRHINKPNISLVADKNLPLNMFFSANTGYEFLVADYLDVVLFPYETKFLVTANYMNQGEYNRLDFGTSIMFKTVFFGVSAATNPWSKTDNSRLVNSMNIYAGLQYEHLRFGISHDFSTSKIGKTGGIYELSLTYQFDLDIKCFGCPNYTTKY